MTVCDGLSDGFHEWVKTTNGSIQVEGDSCVVADLGGEIRFYIRVDVKGTFSLTRADRGGDERPVMWSTTIVDIERYLTTGFGITVRVGKRLGMILGPWRPSDIAAGFSIVDLGDRVLLLKSDHGPTTARFHQGGGEPIVQFSHYADADPATIRASYENPDGHPLFTGWVSDRIG